VFARRASLTDSAVQASLYRDGGRNNAARRAPIDYAHVHDELHKSTATMQLLWAECQEAVGAQGDGLSRFCELYGTWRGRLRPSMR
jgi:transposase